MTTATLGLDEEPIDLHALRLRRAYGERVPFTHVDTYEGQPSEPLFLHKYNYGNGDPVNNPDPTGMFSVTEIGVGTFIAALVIVLTHPNVANAPGPNDRTYSDAGGDMAFSAVASVPIAAGLSIGVRFLVSPALKWASTQASNLFGRQSNVLATRLYRVVSEAEYLHIRTTGRMLPEPSGRSFETGKWFWKDVKAAEKWVQRNPGHYPAGHRIIVAEVPPELTATAVQRANLDQIGDAVFLEIDDLMSAAIKEAQK